MAIILESRNIHYSYEDRTEALKGVDIALEKGRKIAFVGPNGAGKSTLMLMFNGILRPTSGEILFKGEPLKYDSRSLRGIRRKVGMVFQNSDDQLFAPTVYQDIAFGPLNLEFTKDKVDRYVNYAVAYVGLSGYQKRPPHHLSSGEKKRVAIAGILAMEPEVMILDEPTSNLDPASSEEIMDMLDELNCCGKTMIVSTHDVDLAYRWADEVILMENGGVLHRGKGSEVFGDIELIKRARLKLPLVMDIYKELVSRDLLDKSKPPRTILELTDLVESRNCELRLESVSKGDLGMIHICNADQSNPESIKTILEKSHANYIGAMGTNAKFLAEQARIPLDFTYGVIDKCILKALIGKSSLIITSGGMADHAVKRIQDYAAESGAKIEVVKFSSRNKSSMNSAKQEILNQIQEDSTKPTEVAR